MRLCAGYLRRACAPALRRHCQRPSSALRLARAAQQSAAHATASAMQQQGGRQGQQPPAAAAAAAEQGPVGAGTGSTVLDREEFRQQLEVQALRIPTKQCNQYMKLLSKWVLACVGLGSTVGLSAECLLVWGLMRSAGLSVDASQRSDVCIKRGMAVPMGRCQGAGLLPLYLSCHSTRLPV